MFKSNRSKSIMGLFTMFMFVAFPSFAQHMGGHEHMQQQPMQQPPMQQQPQYPMQYPPQQQHGQYPGQGMAQMPAPQQQHQQRSMQNGNKSNAFDKFSDPMANLNWS